MPLSDFSRESLPSWTRPVAPWVGLLLALLTVGGALAYIQYDDYRAADRRAVKVLKYQASVVDENLTKSLQTASNALDRIREDWYHMYRQPDGRGALNARLEAMATSMVGVRTFAVVDGNGEVLASNRAELLGRNFRDSDRYRTIRDGASMETLYVSAPFVTPLGKYAISAGKMLADEHGRFAGYVLAILDTEYFSLLMRSSLFSENMNATLVHGDGTVILRLPDREALSGQNLSRSPDSLFSRFMRMNSEHAVLEGVSNVTGQDLLTVLNKIWPESTKADKPLVFAVSINRDAVYERWRGDTLTRGLAFAIVALLAVLGLALYQRRQRAFESLRGMREAERQQAQEALLRAAESTQLALDSARLGVWHWLATEHCVLWSDMCYAYFGVPVGTEVTLEAWANWLHPDDRDRITGAVRRCIEARSDYEEDYRVIWPDGSEHWLHAVGRPYFSEQGEFVRMEGIIQDVSSRKEAEARLTERKSAG